RGVARAGARPARSRTDRTRDGRAHHLPRRVAAYLAVGAGVARTNTIRARCVVRRAAHRRSRGGATRRNATRSAPTARPLDRRPGPGAARELDRGTGTRSPCPRREQRLPAHARTGLPVPGAVRRGG